MEMGCVSILRLACTNAKGGATPRWEEIKVSGAILYRLYLT